MNYGMTASAGRGYSSQLCSNCSRLGLLEKVIKFLPLNSGASNALQVDCSVLQEMMASLNLGLRTCWLEY